MPAASARMTRAVAPPEPPSGSRPGQKKGRARNAAGKAVDTLNLSHGVDLVNAVERPSAMGCGHPPDSGTWLSRGTGICSNCAPARVAAAMKTRAGRAWFESWQVKLRGLQQRPGLTDRPAGAPGESEGPGGNQDNPELLEKQVRLGRMVRDRR
jgi:hypothetical protein